MPSENKLKVCLVAISLGRGGAERSVAILSQMLTKKGYDVHIVILNDVIDYPYLGTLFNLGEIKNEKDSMLRRLSRFQKLRSYFKNEKFDYIIDCRSRSSASKESYYLQYLYKGFKIVYVIHSGKISQYLPETGKIAQKMVERSYRIVGVSNYITDEVNRKFQTDKAVTIYNPMTPFDTSKPIEIEGKYVLFMGRLEEKVKNLSLLFEGYKQSSLSEKDIRLKILGNGQDRGFLRAKAEVMGISTCVDFIPFTSNVQPYLKNALFTVLTSRYEGFPMTLVESLSVGTPVVSVDCVSGPNEIIIHEKNGLLIENNNPQVLAEAMNRMVQDEVLYETCKENSVDSVAHLSIKNIAAQWDKLLRNETDRS